MPTHRGSNEVLKTRVEVEIRDGVCACALSKDSDLDGASI